MRTHRIPAPRRLLSAVRWAAVLSHGEAEACVRDYRCGRHYSGEAVNHYGGTSSVLTTATHTAIRKLVRRYFREG
jgi:hypothetical protein